MANVPDKPDVYYGDIAREYDAKRIGKQRWIDESDAVNEYVTKGPVLDVPFGTGRFVPIYHAKELTFLGIDISDDMLAQARAKYPRVNAVVGDAFQLDFEPGDFATVVCVRFLEWLEWRQQLVMLDRLRRIAPELIVTFCHGVEGYNGLHVADTGKLLAAFDGLLIAGRKVTKRIGSSACEIFYLRPATWPDVTAQFSHDYQETADMHVQRVADKYAGFFGLPTVPVNEKTAKVRAEYWPGSKLAGIIAETAQALGPLQAGRAIGDGPPRFDSAPITVLERDEAYMIIDGRRRAGQWMHKPGPHPVLLVRV